MTLLALEGPKSYRALQIRNKLFLGLSMLPSYRHMTLQAFLEMIDLMSLEDQFKMCQEAANVVDMLPEEIPEILCFFKDQNGIPYNQNNINNLNPFEIRDMIAKVCMEICRMSITFLTKDEKKNSEIFL